MSATEFLILGGGWRTRFYLDVAKELPEFFRVCGVVEPNAERGEFLHNGWGVPIYQNFDQALSHTKPAFVALCLPQHLLSDGIKEAVEKKQFVLTETFSAYSVEEIEKLYHAVSGSHRVQAAEQYWLQPIHAARLSVIQSGILGNVYEAQVSAGHEYHGISLLRKYLNATFDHCEIVAREFKNPIAESPNRDFDEPTAERMSQQKQEIAILDFNGKWGTIDFTEEQYFSHIRSPRILIRGDQGEINNHDVRYLKEFNNPVEFKLERRAYGVDGSMGIPSIIGIEGGGNWYYKNPFPMTRLSDDEFAIATVLRNMSAFSQGGSEFYSLEEACQDRYLAYLIKQALQTKKVVRTENQPWIK